MKIQPVTIYFLLYILDRVLHADYSITTIAPVTKVVPIAFTSRQLVPFQVCETLGLSKSTGKKEKGSAETITILLLSVTLLLNDQFIDYNR